MKVLNGEFGTRLVELTKTSLHSSFAVREVFEIAGDNYVAESILKVCSATGCDPIKMAKVVKKLKNKLDFSIMVK